MDPNLSVIVPVYNVEPYIRQCLDSLVNQTYQDMEIIVIDDGSPDNCGAICDEYAEKCAKMRVIHTQNAGVGAARNRGMDIARGKWITFVDPDDWIDTDCYEAVFRALGNRKVDIFYENGYFREYKNKSVLSYSAYQEFEYHDRKQLDILMARVIAPKCFELLQSPPAHKKSKQVNGGGVVWNKFYRTEFIRDHNLRFYDQDRKAFWDDMLFNYLAFYFAERVAGSDIFKHHYRIHDSSYMNRYDPDTLDVHCKKAVFIRKAVPEKLDDPLFREAIYANAIADMHFMLKCYYLHPLNPDSRSVVKKRIREMTQLPYYHEALYKSSGRFLSKKRIVLKYLLRQPFLWPIELAVKGNQLLSRNKKI